MKRPFYRLGNAAGMASAWMIIGGSMVMVMTLALMVGATRQALSLGIGMAEMRSRRKRGKA